MVSHHEVDIVKKRMTQIANTGPKVFVICQIARPRCGF